MAEKSSRYRAQVKGQLGPIRRSLSRALRDCYWTPPWGIETVVGIVLAERDGKWVPAFPGVGRG